MNIAVGDTTYLIIAALPMPTGSAYTPFSLVSGYQKSPDLFGMLI